MSSGIIDLAAELVRIPSQAGVDAPDAIVARITDWLRGHAIAFTPLEDEAGQPLGLFARVSGGESGPSLCLNACLDTAPIGDAEQWTRAPFGGVVTEGALWGRGSADSKLGASLLLHLLERFTIKPPRAGTLYVLLDADEHTGGFGGIKAFLDAVPHVPDAMVLGYPGSDALVIGARGFLRCEIKLSGKSAHSGSINRRGINAIQKAAALVGRLHDVRLPNAPSFPLPPGLTVTQFQAGKGFSQVPDSATIGLDIRLTPEFDRDSAEAWLAAVVTSFDAENADGHPSHVVALESWPAYQVDPEHPLVRCFKDAGIQEFGREIHTEICGPSNIGNLLSTRGITTICGLGVAYAHLHAANERADVGDIDALMRIWEAGARAYLS